MSRFKVAIVGAGPAGYFAAQALQNLLYSWRRAIVKGTKPSSIIVN